MLSTIRCGFALTAKVLNVKTKKVSREVLRITAATSEEVRSAVCFDFEFLDSDDGGVVEVLHTGSTKAPECIGTIMGLPMGPQRLGAAFDTLTPSKWVLIGDTIVLSVLGAGLSIAGTDDGGGGNIPRKSD